MAAPSMATNEQTAGDAALRRGAWDEARGRFEAALAAGAGAAAWEGLGWAAY